MPVTGDSLHWSPRDSGCWVNPSAQLLYDTLTQQHSAGWDSCRAESTGCPNGRSPSLLPHSWPVSTGDTDVFFTCLILQALILAASSRIYYQSRSQTSPTIDQTKDFAGFPGGSAVKNPPANAETQVQFLVWRSPHTIAKLMQHNCWAHEPMAATREATAPQLESAPTHCSRRRACTMKTQHSQKQIKIRKKITKEKKKGTSTQRYRLQESLTMNQEHPGPSVHCRDARCTGKPSLKI